MTILRYAILVLAPWAMAAAFAADDPAAPPQTAVVQTARAQPAALPATASSDAAKSISPVPAEMPTATVPDYADNQFEQVNQTTFEKWWQQYTDALRRAE